MVFEKYKIYIKLLYIKSLSNTSLDKLKINIKPCPYLL